MNRSNCILHSGQDEKEKDNASLPGMGKTGIALIICPEKDSFQESAIRLIRITSQQPMHPAASEQRPDTRGPWQPQAC